MSQLKIEMGGLQPIAGGLPQFASTKTVPPVVSKLAVERPRLMASLDAAATRKLTVIKAPAGYGKTTLAAAWCNRLRRAGAVVAWLSLDADDNEPGSFAYHLAKGIERAAADLGRDAIELLKASSLMPPRNVISALLNAANESEAEIFVLLDDYHVVADSGCHDLVAFILRYAPSNLHLVLLTRAEPRLPLSRLRLEDEVVEIDASGLQFDLNETRQFLGSDLCDSLQAKGVAALFAATEGWPAALQLACISLRSSSNPIAHLKTLSGTTHKISEYLEDTFTSLPDEDAQLLMKISILDQMNGALCEAVTGVRQSGVLLARQERQQFLLIALDETGEWYRFHHLMREFLLNRLNQTMSHQVAELHHRAYDWYAAEGYWREAVQHALAAKHFDRALEFVSQCAMSLVIKGDLLTLLAWERQLPSELMSGQFEVKLALAWGMALVTRFKEADALLVQVEKAAEATPGSDLWWKCRAARSINFALMDNSARARELAAECLEGYKFDPFNFNALCNVIRYDHLKAANWAAFDAVAKPEISAGEASYVLPENYRLCLHGMAAVQQLRFDEALKYYADAKALAEKYAGSMSVSATMITGLIAQVNYERGDVRGAEVSVLDTLDLIETTAFHEGFLQAFLVLVRAAAGRGDNQRALSLLNRAERLGWERGWGRVVAALLVERMRLLLSERNIQEAHALLMAFEHLRSQYIANRRCSWSDIETCYTIAKGLVAGATGHTEDAIAFLQEAYDALLSVQNLLEGVRVGLDLALAKSRAGARSDAFGLLRNVLGQAAKEDLVTFVLERKDAVGLISTAKDLGALGGQGALRDFVTQLLERQRGADGPVSLRATQRLTERERSIVGCIAAGHSNKEIARELGVAPETVKTHIKRIFQKLSAETRAQAVVRAQSLGMLGGPSGVLGPQGARLLKPASQPL